jgi:hypothetical protein
VLLSFALVNEKASYFFTRKSTQFLISILLSEFAPASQPARRVDSQLANKAASQQACDLASQPDGQQASELASQPTSPPARHPASQTASQPASQAARWPASRQATRSPTHLPPPPHRSTQPARYSTSDHPIFECCPTISEASGICGRQRPTAAVSCGKFPQLEGCAAGMQQVLTNQ